MTKVRMEWTMSEFFDNGGTTAFIDRLCASLGIHASTVKVVGVNQASVLVNYEITPSKDEPLSLDQIKKKQTQSFATGAVDLGAPITSVSDGGESIVEDGVVVAAGFKPTVLVKTETNQGSAVLINWIYPWLWESAQIGAVDVPSMMIYELIYLGLQYLWNGLRWEVKLYADDYERSHMNTQQTAKINDHVINTVLPEDDEEDTPTPSPIPRREQDDGTTLDVSDDGASDDM
jgi:hypothetical protein